MLWPTQQKKYPGWSRSVSLLVSAAGWLLLLTLLDCFWEAYWTAGSRVRTVGPLGILRVVLRAGLDLSHDIPDVLNRYRELRGPGDFLEFFQVAGASALVILGVVWLVLAAICLLIGRWAPGGADFERRLRAYLDCAGLLLIGVVATRWMQLTEIRLSSFAASLLFAVAFLACLAAGLRWLQRLCPRSLHQGLTASMLSLLGLSIIYAAATSQAPQAPPRPGLPNILLVSVDSLRADHLESYGYGRQTSPTLTRLADEGARFETAISPSSWTLPTHLTLLTGLSPVQHRVVDDGARLADSAVSMAEILRDAGYSTAGFVSGPYLSAPYGHAQGFQHYDDYSTVRLTELDQWAEISSPTLLRLSQRFLRDWDAAGRQRPFFLFLHMFDVHFDYVPPPPFDTLYDPDYEGSIDGRNIPFTMDFHPGMSQRDLDHLLALYDGEIRFTDDHIGRLISDLAALGALDNTIVLVTSDHGEEFLDHGDKMHRRTLYEEVLRVPLIIRYPARIRPGTIVERPVRLMDVSTTLLSLAGVVPREGSWVTNRGSLFESVDLTPLLQGRDEDLPRFFAFADLHGEIFAARTSTTKLIQTISGSSSIEFYDLVADPEERHNLAGEDERVNWLIERLALWRELRPKGAAVPVHVDAQHLEVLRSLGYVQ